jgi:hypothetical protein
MERQPEFRQPRLTISLRAPGLGYLLALMQWYNAQD